ncbi:unnamed protein product [Brugia timori]|uniref:Transmembrane protein n=1 Tax=Brugia timori TaxID=42155 RepID=A0A0R3R2P0_9BILA|nr:unnamed protein product [Brugia timori]
MLNETIELHQAEMIALKSDLNTIATRMDYQYSDRFRSIEENIESTQNKMIRMEVNVKEWTEFRPQTTFNSVMLSGTNILVEFIKLVLLIVSFALDFVKPFTGTRFVTILIMNLFTSGNYLVRISFVDFNLLNSFSLLLYQFCGLQDPGWICDFFLASANDFNTFHRS